MSAEAKDRNFRIIINGRPTDVEGEIEPYESIVNLAFDGNPPQGPNVRIVVTYSKGPKDNREGGLTAGNSVTIKNEMVFNVKATDRS